MSVERLKEAREAKFAGLFRDRRWRVCTEMTGSRTVGGIKLTYRAGAVTIDPPGKFNTPLGSPGRRGFILAEVGPDGADTGELAVFGAAILRKAHQTFGSIINLPGAGDGPEA